MDKSIREIELEQHLARVKLHRDSYHAKMLDCRQNLNDARAAIECIAAIASDYEDGQPINADDGWTILATARAALAKAHGEQSDV